MNESTISLWWTVMIVGMVGSAIYSGLETGIYRINRVRLQILDHQRQRSARILNQLVHRPTTLLSTLLIGNNVSNYMGTAAMAVILEHQGFNDWQVIVFNILIITPMLLIFGEVLPKDLFSAHSDRLTYQFAWLLDLSRKLFWCSGLLLLIEGVSNQAARLLHTPSPGAAFHPRRQVELLVKEGVGHGLLSDEQSAIVERVMALSTLTVADEMVPWEKVTKVRVNDPPSMMWDLADRTSFSRFPVTDASGQVIGLMSIYNVLQHSPEQCPPLRELMSPALTIDATTPLRRALTTLQTQHAALAVVTRNSKPVGVVTIKDLVEPITGELASW